MLPPPNAAESAEPAEWVRGRYRWDGPWTDFGVGIGFEAYVRIFHPYDEGDDDPRTWAQVAAEHGKTMHASAQWEEITADGPWDPNADYDSNRNGGVYLAGNLPKPVLHVVCDVLRQHTTSPDHCYFAVWEGWGWDTSTTTVSYRLDTNADTPAPPEPRALPIRLDANAPRFDVPYRSFLLYTGVVEQAAQIGGGTYREGRGFSWQQSPTVMWPADHSWCLATEVDLEYTIIGGSTALASALVAAHGIEAFVIAPDALPIDTINQ